MSGPAKRLCAICLAVGVAVATGGITHAGTPVDPKVVEGTWHFATFSDIQSTNDPGIEKTRLTVDATGNVTGGIWSDSWNDSGGISGGSIKIDAEGEIEGSITYSGDRTDTVNISDFRLSPERDVVFGLNKATDNRVSLTLVAKGGSGFATSDLAGTWHLFNFWDEKAPETGSAGWTRATITVNNSGVITSATDVVDSEGESFSISGSMNITSDGVVGLDVTAGGESVAIDDLRMPLNKTLIGGVWDESEDVNIAIMTKAGSSYATADLEGTWYAFSFEDKEGGQDPGWTRSFFSLNSSGAVTAGEDVEDDGSVSNISSGSFSIAGDGSVSGTIDGEAVGNFQMDASKDFIAGVNSEPDGDRLFAVIVKATRIPADFGAVLPIIQLLQDD